MSELRVFGKEVTIRVVRNGNLLTEITAIKSFNFEMRSRIITEQYLGESASRQDEIFDEVGGSFTVHPEGTEILSLQRLIFERSQRRIADDEKVGCTFRVQFPSQQIARISIPDMKFDPIAVNVGSRDAYVEMPFTFKSDRYILTL